MTTAMIAQQAIDDFLRQKIQITIEQKQKKAKDSFTQDDVQKIHDEYAEVHEIGKAAPCADQSSPLSNHGRQRTPHAPSSSVVRDA